jgi:hypothetical protein
LALGFAVGFPLGRALGFGFDFCDLVAILTP